MSLNVHDLSARLFVHGLINLKALLTKAEAQATASGSDEVALLDARLAGEGCVRGVASAAPHDAHRYSLAAQVHWAAEGARLAIARLLGAPAVPAASDEKSFADLYQRLDSTIAYLRELAPRDLEASLDRALVIEHHRGTTSYGGSQFLLEFAIPHFYYHVTTAYGILRSQGVQLTMADFLGGLGTA